MLLVVNILYAAVLLFSVIAALFIAYHIIRYAMSQTELVLTLTLFLSVFLALLFFNIVLFLRVDFAGMGGAVTGL